MSLPRDIDPRPDDIKWCLFRTRVRDIGSGHRTHGRDEGCNYRIAVAQKTIQVRRLWDSNQDQISNDIKDRRGAYAFNACMSNGLP